MVICAGSAIKSKRNTGPKKHRHLKNILKSQWKNRDCPTFCPKVWILAISRGVAKIYRELQGKDKNMHILPINIRKIDTDNEIAGYFDLALVDGENGQTRLIISGGLIKYTQNSPRLYVQFPLRGSKKPTSSSKNRHVLWFREEETKIKLINDILKQFNSI